MIAGDVVGDVVPAEVDGGDDGEAEVDPEDDLEHPAAQRVLHHQRDQQGDRAVQAGEAGDRLHGALDAAVQDRCRGCWTATSISAEAGVSGRSA